VIADVGDVPVQDIRACGVKDERLMKLISDSVKIVMDQVYTLLIFETFYF